MENKEERAIIELIKVFLKENCPYLNELSKINVDYLNTESKDFEYWSLEQLEAPLILKRNVLGTKTERQCQFILASRSFFNPTLDTQNIKNLHLFGKIADWMHECTRNGNLPILNDEETSISIETTSPGYLYGTDKSNTIARYQMDCKFIYEKKESMKER